MSTIERFEHPSAWQADQLRHQRDWEMTLTPEELEELDAAVRHANRAGIWIPECTAKDFPLDRLARRLADIRSRLENGVGLVLLHGMPVTRYSRADIALMYWGMGAHIGPAFAQNMQGDVLGHVRDLGASRSDPKARGYQTRELLPFHNDSTDVVGLLCLQVAKAGGQSRVASALAIHNELVSTRPDLAQALYGTFCQDRRGEQPQGEPPFFETSFFARHEGRVFTKFNRSYVESAQRFPEVPRLTPLQIEAMETLSRLCQDPRFCLEMELAVGDIQFVCNHALVHSRTQYEDHPEPSRKRHLLRLWLRTPGFASRPAAFAQRDRDMLAWQSHPKPPIFDVSEVQAELAH